MLSRWYSQNVLIGQINLIYEQNILNVKYEKTQIVFTTLS